MTSDRAKLRTHVWSPLPCIHGKADQKSIAAAALLLLLLTGCAAHKLDPIPTFPQMSNADALAVLRERLAALHTVQAQASLILTDAKGQRVSLDGVYLLDTATGSARLRAWKFTQAVFDLTVARNTSYLVLPKEAARPAMNGVRDSVRLWMSLLDPHAAIYGQGGSTFGGTLSVTQHIPELGWELACDIDRATLTPRQYSQRVTNNFGILSTVFRLELSDYRVIAGGQVWPMTMRAISDGGTIEVHTTDVQINETLPAKAFEPPARAERLRQSEMLP